MNSTKANILNSVCLILIGLWGYFEVSSPTALIPVGFGVALLYVPKLKLGVDLSVFGKHNLF